jgi:hypothetical protein
VIVKARSIRWAAPHLAVAAVLAFAVAPALATSPTILREHLHRERPFITCPSGKVLVGNWDVDRTTTTWFDASGTPVRDHFVIHFFGTLSNPDTGASVPDSGIGDFKDELAPDGSFVSSIYTYERTNPYLHEAGQQLLGPSDANGDQDTLRTTGMSHFDSGIPALCAALGA